MRNLTQPRFEMDSQGDVKPGHGHPLGTGVGALLGGAATGAVVGTVAGPVGATLGVAAGAIVGALAGRGIAVAIDPQAEELFWRDNYQYRPYAGGDTSYDDYGPAYRYGVDAFGMYPGLGFDDVEARLSRDWPHARGSSSLDWDRARHAARDAWDRLSEPAVSGDADHDRK